MTVGPRVHGTLIALVGVAALALCFVPVYVAFGLGWMTLGWSQEAGSIGQLVDDNPIEAWVLLALGILVWTPVVVIGFVVALDRLGRHYTPVEREERPDERESRRRRAGLRFLAGRGAPSAPKSRRAPEAMPAPKSRRAPGTPRPAGGSAARRTRPAPATRPALARARPAPAERPARPPAGGGGED